MMNLLRFHFHFSKKMIIFSALIVAGFFFLHTGSTLHIPITPVTLMLLLYIPSMCSFYILNEQLSYMIRLLPVTSKQFVQSTYLYVAILFGIIFIPSFLFIAYQYFTGDAGNFKFSFFLGVIAYCIIATGGIINNYFKQPTKAEKNMSSSDSLFYMFFISIPHVILTTGFSFFNLTILGALLVPLFSPFIFYKFYKSSVLNYEKAEF